MTQRLVQRVLPVVAIAAFALAVAAIVLLAGKTLGFDYLAYEGGAHRLLDGRRLYDPAIEVAGGFGIFYYPPPFAVAILPFALISGQAAVWMWTILLVAAFLTGVALLPVSRSVKWVVLILAALDWPFLYSIKLGQVGPILFLLFAVGWRSLDRPTPLGAVIGLGALIKIQPALLVAWAVLTRRWLAAAVAVAVMAAGALLATAVAGIQPWLDYPGLLGRVSSPLTTPHNFTPGAIAYQGGVSIELAGFIQIVATVGALAAVVIAARTTTGDASYLVAVVASQLISPLLWDHYAMILLLPVAWLLERRLWWAVIIPAATSILVIGLLPAAVYPIAFATCLILPIVLGRQKVGTFSAVQTATA